MNSKKTFTEFISILLNHSKNQRVSSTMELILQGQYHSHTKSKDITHTHTHTHTYVSTSMMNIDSEILNKVLANQI